MILYNQEVKKLFIKYIAIFLISIAMVVGVTNLSLSIIKNKVVENNQIIIGSVLNKYPELEEEIVGIITQGRKRENLELGKSILEKYSYSENIGLNLEPIIGQSKTNLLKLNMLLVLLVLSMTLAIIILYLKNMYREIEDMTNYVYNSSEGKHYNMKKYNQEGQLGFLKTELVKMTSILKENVDLLKKEKVFLNNSISDISHQLKTPMTSLIILNDIMYDDIPQDIKIDFLDKIKSQLNRMDWLIKSMLKLSKVEAKVIDFKKEEINIKELIHKSIEPVKIPMEIKNISLIINGDNQSKFYGDMNWCVEAMLNIIKNCVEHTPEEGTLEITYEENPLFSEIIIKDSGEGISKEDIPHIFKRFYKGKNSTKEDSVGIGLAMAKRIIESQNGDIFVKSEKNKGTEFHISIHKSYSD